MNRILIETAGLLEHSGTRPPTLFLQHQLQRDERPSTRPITLKNSPVSKENLSLSMSTPRGLITPQMTPSASSEMLIKDPAARTVWKESGGVRKRKLSLKDLVMDLYNHCCAWTQARCKVVMDEHSIGPFFKRFSHDTSDPPSVSVREFNRLWSWFDALCAAMKDMMSFWSDPIAIYHGFVTRDEAEQVLRLAAAGTFIVRFDAPNTDIIVSVRGRTERVRHESFGRNTQSGHIREHRLLAEWINENALFQYVYHSEHAKCHKKGFFK